MSELSVNLNSATDYHADSGATVSPEQTMITRIASGNEAALVMLIELHGTMLARLIGRLMAWHADCDDILQDVLLTVWQKAEQFDGKGSLEGWLKRIAINRCRNHFRMLNSIARKVEGFAAVLASHQAPLKQAKTYNDDRNTKLQQALGELSHSDRTVLVLYYLEELPGKEVAETLGIGPAAIHVRLNRARGRLRKLIEKKKRDD